MDAATPVASTVSVAATTTVITPAADESVGSTTNGSALPLVVKDTQVRLLVLMLLPVRPVNETRTQ